jgi:hypothetical protein
MGTMNKQPLALSRNLSGAREAVIERIVVNQAMIAW